MKKLNDLEYNILGIDIDYTFRGEIESLKLRMGDPISWLPLELFLKENKIRKKFTYSKKF